MKKTILLIPFILLTFFPLKSHAQIEDLLDFYTINNSDSNLNILGPSKTKYYYLKDDSMFIFKSKHDAKNFIDSSGSSFPFGFKDIDFEKNTLILMSYSGGDCHARFRHYVVKNEYSKIFTVCVDVIYGGCRAGGRFFTTWALIPNQPEDYEVKFSSRMVDREGR